MTNYNLNLSDLTNSYLDPGLAAIVHEIIELSRKQKKRVVMVGGVVRDFILRKPVKEIDFMMEHPLVDWVKELAGNISADVTFHPKFLTATIHTSAGFHIDFVTARTEKYPRPGGLPVVSPSSIEADLKRRDFTVNSLAAWICGDRLGHVLDLHGGVNDIQNNVIRVLHANSFIDDPTRIYRAARFAGRLSFSIEGKTMGYIQDAINSHLPSKLSAARLRNEFFRILKEDDPMAVFSILESWEGLKFIHHKWKVLPAHKTSFSNGMGGESVPSFEKRLIWWFKPWGKPEAQKMMLELGFERALKKKVLQNL